MWISKLHCPPYSAQVCSDGLDFSPSFVEWKSVVFFKMLSVVKEQGDGESIQEISVES